MEYRDDLEQILLDGLDDDERRQTTESMANETAEKLAHLRSLNSPDESEEGSEEGEDVPAEVH